LPIIRDLCIKNAQLSSYA